MKKQQVKAILDMTKNIYREPLECLQVDLYNGRPVLVATDGYILIAMYADASLVDKVGYCMKRKNLEIWYKLASGKSVFGTNDLDLEKNDRFPKWQEIIKNTERKEAKTIGFDSKLASRLETIAGEQLYYKLSGDGGAMIANTDNGLFLLMPLKPKKEAN
jgi:hypothetical protein